MNIQSVSVIHHETLKDFEFIFSFKSKNALKKILQIYDYCYYIMIYLKINTVNMGSYLDSNSTV